MHTFRRWLLALVFVALMTPQVRSQVSNGSIVGTAFDPSGAVVPHASLTLTNVNTQFQRNAQTDAAGNYVFAELLPGVYSVTASVSGFRNATIARIVLEVSQTVRADIHLGLQSTGQEVTVAAPLALLETQTSSVGQVITERTIQDLPLNGRNFLQLATLGSGVIPATRGDGRTNGAVIASGSRYDQNTHLIDGVEATGIQLGSPTVLLSPDAIQEFTLLKNGFDARYGQGSAAISMVTKSGTNSFHGSVYEFLRNNHLDAANYFDNFFGRTKPIYQQNQFGASAGGPIVKNKVFFFGNYEGLRIRQGNTLSGMVPPPAMLSGNFSGIAAIIKDPLTGQPFPNNVIPSDRISKAATVFNPLIPAPNVNRANVNYLRSPSTKRDDNQFTTRIDWNVSPKDSMFGRYIWYKSPKETPALMETQTAYAPYSGQTASIQETHTFGPAAINVIMLGYSRGINLTSWMSTPTNFLKDMGLQNVPDIPSTYGYPAVSLVGYAGLGGFVFQGGGISNTYQISDEFTWIRGRHDLHFGADLRRVQFQFPATSFATGVFTFDGRYSGNSVADYLLGNTSAATIQQIPAIANHRQNQTGFFVQDNIRVTPRFTLNLGLRYERDTPFYEKNGKEGYFDTSTRKIVVRVPSSFTTLVIPSSKITYDPSFRQGIWRTANDFMPRLGAAYRVGDNWSVRGGFGLFYAKTEGNQLQGKSNLPPLSYTASLTGSVTTPNLSMSSLFPSLADQAVSTLSPFSVDPNDKRPYTIQWNFGVERRITSSVLAEVAYVGNRGLHLVERVNINQGYLPANPANPSPLDTRRPYPGWGDILSFNWSESSIYNGLQMRLEKRFSRGLSFLASYTWSHALDTASATNQGSATNHQDAHNLRADYASADYDVPQRFTASFLYELPFGVGKPFLSRGVLVNRLLGGWQVNGITTFAVGYADSVTVSGDRANTGGSMLQRANLVGACNGNLPSGERTIQRYFNTSCFAVTPFGTYGNSGRNIIRLPGVNNWDMSVFKNMSIKEKVRVQFRVEMFNAWNHAQFGAPVLNVQSPTFGQILSAGAPRLIQFGLKFLW